MCCAGESGRASPFSHCRELPTTEEPTEAPTEAPSGAPTTEESTDAPTTEEPNDAPTTEEPNDSFTLSPIASTSSVVSGLAAPGPVPTRERRLSEDILTVADFVQTLDAAMKNLLLGVPFDASSCIVESSAIQYAASDSVCTEAFDQLAGSFCYSFQTTISPPTSGEHCEVNAAADIVTGVLAEGGFRFAEAIGFVADVEIIQLATTNSPTSAPTEAPTTPAPCSF